AIVKDIKHHHYSRHDFLLHVDGLNPFTVNGRHLEELINYSGPTSKKIKVDSPKDYYDFFSRKICIGNVIYFARSSKSRGGIEMVMGTVLDANHRGLWVNTFQINDQKITSTD